MYRWMLMGWVVLGMVGNLEAQQYDQPTDYTCEMVRGPSPKSGSPYGRWKEVSSREEATAYFQELQAWTHQKAIEEGAERSGFLKDVLYRIGNYLTCEDKMKIIVEDIRFYDKHQDLLPQKTFPWSLKGMECARDFIRSELKKGDLSRMYRGWLIVQASYFWYDEFRDSLLAVARDPSYPPMFRRDVVASIPTWDTSETMLQFLISLADTDRAKIMTKTIKGEPEPYYPVRHMAAIKLRHMKKDSLIPESYRRWYELFQKRMNPHPGYRRKQGTGLEVALYFQKDGWIGGVPAWYWYWMQFLPGMVGIPSGKITYGTCPYGADGCYTWGEDVIVVSQGGADSTLMGTGYARQGIDFTATVLLHEWAHYQYFWNAWSPLIMDENGIDYSLVPVYDHDRDGLVDLWEASGPHYVGQARVVFDSSRIFEHTFYGVHPYWYEGSEGLWVALHECLWIEGSADSLDWSWGMWSKQTTIDLQMVGGDPDVDVVHPSGSYERRWVFYPGEGWKTSGGSGKIPVEDGIPIQALWLGEGEGKFRWRILWDQNWLQEVTDPGELKVWRLPPVMPLAHDEFGKDTLWVEFEEPLCLLSRGPGDGDRGVPVISPITLAFTHPMDTISVRQGLNITPSFPWQWGFTV